MNLICQLLNRSINQTKRQLSIQAVNQSINELAGQLVLYR